MTEFLRTARRWLWGTIALTLILAAVLLSAARLALPFAAEYRGQIAQYLSDYLEAPVAIGDLDVEWRQLGPRLRVEDLAVAAPVGNGEPARVERAYLELALAWPRESTWLPFRIRDVVLSGIDMRIGLDHAGRPALTGDSPGGERERGLRDLARRIAAVERLQIRDARITLLRDGRDPLVLRDAALRWRSAEGRQRVALQADLPSALGGRMRAALDLRGPPGAYREWRGSGYLRGGNLDAAAWLDLLHPAAAVRGQGSGELELWAHWADGALQRVQARGAVRDLSLVRGDAAAVEFARLGGRFAWTRTDSGWRIDGTDITVERGGRRWHASGFSVAREADAAGAAEWRGRADFARVDDLLALGRVMPELPLARWLPADRATRGDVRRLRFATGGGAAPTVRATVRDLGWAAGDGVPGVQGLDGRVAWSGDRGHIELTTADASLRAPALFRAPLPIADLRGRVAIARTADGMRIRVPNLTAANGDVRTSTRGELWWPEDGAARIDLEVELAEGDGTAVRRYLPVGVMDPEVVAWIDRAFAAGRVDRGQIVWRGAIADFPHETAPGTFEAELQVSGVQLDYAPDWPGLLRGDGRIRFAGRSLSVQATDARLLDTRIDALSVGIDDFKDAQLRIEADAHGPLGDLVTVINGSPLRKRLGAFFDGARAEGPAGLTLDLRVPLRDPEDARAEGRLQLSGNRFVQSRFGLDLSGLEGPLHFTDAGLRTDELEARLRGQAVRIDARTYPEPAHRLRVAIRGELGLQHLLPGLPPAAIERIDGAARWYLQVHVPLGAERGDRPIRLRATSDLVGTRVDLPAPLGKAAPQRRVLHVEFPVARDGGLQPGRIGYGERLEAELALAGRRGDLRIETGRIQLGPEPLSPLPDDAEREPGLHLRGGIAALDLEAWGALIRALRPRGPADAGADDGGAAFARLASVELEVGRASLAGYRVSDIDVRAEREDAGWQIAFAGPQLAGHARIPAQPGQGAQPLRLRLQRLVLEAAAAGGDGAARGGTAPIDPAALPPLDLRIEHLALPTGPLRQVALVSAPVANGLALRRLEFANPALELEGSGHWRAGEKQETALSLEIHSDNFGAGLEALGLGGALGRGDGRMTADLVWPGPPWAPVVAELEGQTRIRLEDGVFKPVDPGLARVFGLLDLRGMLEYGFQFAEFTGRVDFAGGQARTDNLTIDGSAGRLRFRGRTDLGAREYDHTITYRPELKRSLPLFGALSGGPVTGLAVALVQSLLRNLGADMESAAELTYSLTGPWDDPTVERVSTDPNGPERGPRSTGGGGQR